ncbi:MAG: hypothetical protein U0527_17185 [Candidatus Eisenbacteria bacterium]
MSAFLGLTALLIAARTDAGVNAGGVLLLHHSTQVVFCNGVHSYCGQSGLFACETANPRADGDQPIVIFALAAFGAGQSPQLAGATFGVQYDNDVVVIDHGNCADFEQTTAQWPASGEGTEVAWSAPPATLLTEVYWFAAYAYGGAATALFLAPPPALGAYFTDDSLPVVMDPIAELGHFGFNQSGYAPCPANLPQGRCCLPSGQCVDGPYEQCLAQGGNYYGPGVPCSALPCPPTGACCLHGECSQRTADDCADQGGEYFGDGASCTGIVCTPDPPTGGCCLPDGHCEMLVESECLAQGGTYAGDHWQCWAVPCPPWGACCVDGDCQYITRAECEAAGGQYFGDFENCSAFPCRRGACCLAGQCQRLTQVECEEQGGIYRGDGVACASIDCALGACCVNHTCVEMNASDCAAAGGTFEGAGTICGYGLCVNTPCVPGKKSGIRGPEPARLTLTRQPPIRGERDESCGQLLLNADASYETGYNWQYGGVRVPNFGALAECYTATQASVCAIALDLTQVGFGAPSLIDLYVWDDDEGCPGTVLCLRNSVHLGAPAFYPAFSRDTIPLDNCCVDGRVWIGFWPQWPGQIAQWYVGADLNGPGGCSKTNIAPGIGYPSGWNNVSVVWGPTQALGIGCEVQSCAPVAVSKMSWGKVKALYNSAK